MSWPTYREHVYENLVPEIFKCVSFIEYDLLPLHIYVDIYAFLWHLCRFMICFLWYLHVLYVDIYDIYVDSVRHLCVLWHLCRFMICFLWYLHVLMCFMCRYIRHLCRQCATFMRFYDIFVDFIQFQSLFLPYFHLFWPKTATEKMFAHFSTSQIPSQSYLHQESRPIRFVPAKMDQSESSIRCRGGSLVLWRPSRTKAFLALNPSFFMKKITKNLKIWWKYHKNWIKNTKIS